MISRDQCAADWARRLVAHQAAGGSHKVAVDGVGARGGYEAGVLSVTCHCVIRQGFSGRK
jgi:hypothetical protein